MFAQTPNYEQQNQEEPINAVEGEGFDQQLFQQQNQLWNQQKTLTQDQINQQRDQQNQIEYKLAEVKKAKCRLPPTCEAIIDLFQLVLVILIVYFNLIASDPLIPLRIIPIFFFTFITCTKCFMSSPRYFLNNCVTLDEVQKYYNNMKTLNPVVQYSVEAYHYKRVRSGKRTRRRKVTTYRDKQQLIYNRCEDNSSDLTLLFSNTKCLRLITKLYCHKGNQLASNNWKLMSQVMKVTASNQDSHHRGWDSSYVQGLKSYQTVVSGSMIFLNKNVMHLFYLLGLSLIFDTVFYSLTGYCYFNVQKTVYCDVFMMDQINTMMNPLLNPQAQQQQQQQAMMAQQNPMLMQQQQAGMMMPQQQQAGMMMMPQQQQAGMMMMPQQQQGVYMQQLPLQQQPDYQQINVQNANNGI